MTIIATGFDKKAVKSIEKEEEIVVVKKDPKLEDSIDDILKIVNETRKKTINNDFDNNY